MDPLTAIEAADLSAPCYRTGRRLLDRAGSNGVLWLDLVEALRLAGTDSPNTLRRHLSDLAGAGIISYQVDAQSGVWVRFVAGAAAIQAAPVITQCAETITQCAPPSPVNGNGAAPVITQCAETITQCAQNPPIPPYGLVGWLDPEGSDPTNQPGARAGQPAIGATENARSYALLIDPDVGLAPNRAKRLAAAVGFEELLRYVAAWSLDYAAGRVKGAGALVARIEQELGAPPVSAEFRAGELYARHVDVAAERAAAYAWFLPEPGEKMDEMDDPPPPPTRMDDAPLDGGVVDDEAAGAWADALAELEQTLPPATFDTWLRNARLLGIDGEVATIGLKDAYARDWLQNRLGGRLRRLLATLLGRPVRVEFVVNALALPAGAMAETKGA